MVAENPAILSLFRCTNPRDSFSGYDFCYVRATDADTAMDIADSTLWPVWSGSESPGAYFTGEFWVVQKWCSARKAYLLRRFWGYDA